MNRLQSSAKKNAVEDLTEDLLWAKGLLGGETPNMLLDTVVVYNGLYFALRSGGEHCLLRHSPCQVEVVEKPGERPYLVYHEDRDTSRNHPSGLQGCKTMPIRLLFATPTHRTPRDASSLYLRCIDNFALTIQWTTHSTCNHRFLQLRPAGTHGNHWVTPRSVLQWLDCANKLAPTTNQTQERLTRDLP